MYLAERFDLNSGMTARTTYIVASSHRSGSSYLCGSLWKTGKLGAPWEYLEHTIMMPAMMARLKASSFPEYMEKLMACRTSENGVFGLKAHFHHFEHALRTFPRILECLPGLKFIFINRKDKIAQAVSMAKALQNNAWVYFGTVEHEVPLFYSFEFIKRCLQEAVSQTESWLHWLDGRFEPLVVDYEDLVQDRAAVVRAIASFIGVDPGTACDIDLPVTTRQGDSVNEEWLRRFKADAGL
jgi:trehalose 2-sulfotransferase